MANEREPVLGYGRQSISPEDVAAVERVLNGERLTQGPAARDFEAALRDATGAAHAVCVSNGTAALHAAHLALGIGAGDVVITSANTFLASAVAAVHCGATPEFVDIEPGAGNLDLDALEARLTAGTVRCVVAVHFAGLPVAMDRLLTLKRRYGFALIEDAAHALGAAYTADGRRWRVGEHPEVDATILSFHPVKLVTTAEGGAVLTHDVELAERVRRLANHGVDTARPDNPTPMLEPGFNWRLSDVHAALGVSQMSRASRFLERRRQLAARYDANLAEVLPHAVPPATGPDPAAHARHLYWIHVDGRDELRGHLAQRGIATQIHYVPVPDQPWFRQAYGDADVPRAREHGRRALSLPLFPAMSDADQDRVLQALAEWSGAPA